MPLTVSQRRDLVMADRSLDAAVVGRTVRDLLAANPDVTLYDCELALRDAAAHSYLIHNPNGGYIVVVGVQAWREALQAQGIEAKDNARILQSRRMAAGPTPGVA
jgi:hypothetical protein